MLEAGLHAPAQNDENGTIPAGEENQTLPHYGSRKGNGPETQDLSVARMRPRSLAFEYGSRNTLRSSWPELAPAP